jgi:subtilisin family serine protease
MSDSLRVIVQMRSTPSLAAASFGPLAVAPIASIAAVPGVRFDSSYAPVPIPPSPGTDRAAFLAMAATPAAPTYVLRAAVQRERIDDFLTQANQDPHVVGVFADARIQPIAPVCPAGPVGTDLDVEELLAVADLHARGMDGAGVLAVIVDTGVNMTYLRDRGKHPAFDSELSWGPLGNQPLGEMPVDHGTMCAYDVCIAAPRCTLVDHALLTSEAGGGSVMDGFLSDAVQSYGLLLSYMVQAPGPFAGDSTPRTLVVNNSWGMFHQSWDFPVGSPQNYSDNPDHPFNIIVASLEAAGADILFAAGNCGTECADLRCQGVTNAGIFGANSHEAVLSVAGVKIDKQRIGYSTKGPGRLVQQKPDVASYTHFAGSGVYDADGGTSAATPVLAGVVAAVRRLYPASLISPDRMRDLIRETAEPRGNGAFNFEYGHGIIDVAALLTALEDEVGPVAGVAGRGAGRAKRSKTTTRAPAPATAPGKKSRRPARGGRSP